MLRVGLTGGLGSGKSTVARLLAARGAHILHADEIARELMLRGNKGVYEAIVARFGSEVVGPGGQLDRPALARIAFTENRVEELNAIVHPATIARQAELAQTIFDRDPKAIVVVESALIFETKHGGKNGWRTRFDCVILVTAPEDVRIERYVQRMSKDIGWSERTARREAFAREARKRMEHQLTDAEKIPLADYVLHNEGSLADLKTQVEALWPILQERSNKSKKMS